MYTPEDGGNWLLAKLNVQITDAGYAGIVEHLAKVMILILKCCTYFICVFSYDSSDNDNHNDKRYLSWNFFFKIHYLMEPFCVILKRTFSSQHPLHQILKFHCREMTVPNAFVTPTLVNEAGLTDLLFAYGNTGTIRLLKDSHKVATWEVTNLKEEVKVCCHAILLSLVITKSCDTNLAKFRQWKL